jgi:hypothetical protein
VESRNNFRIYDRFFCTAIVAGAVVLPSTTNRYTLRKNIFTSATGVNTMNSLRGEPMYYRGAT